MNIRIPIKIDLSRPKKVEDSPYGICDHCLYVGTEIVSKRECPICHTNNQNYTNWPVPELIELWHEEVAMWNQERVELAVVIAAMYFEASVFSLIYQGTTLLDPELNWIGTAFDSIREKTERIWAFLYNIRTHNDTDAVLTRLFGASGRDMLIRILERNDADDYWDNYRKLAEYRNKIVHCGKRAIYRAFGEPQIEEPEAYNTLNWCLHFIPICWTVFSKLHNEYIHKPIWSRKQNSSLNGKTL
jgi:hypothetical protein